MIKITFKTLNEDAWRYLNWQFQCAHCKSVCWSSMWYKWDDGNAYCWKCKEKLKK